MTGQKNAGLDYVEVTVRATGLVMHENAAGNEGFWVGVKLTHPANITLADATAHVGWTDATPTGKLTDVRSSGDDTMSAFYFNATLA